MKKILALVLALALALALCACGEEKAPESGGPRSDVEVTPIPKPSESGSGKTETPATPAPTDKPAAPDILVTDKCDVSGTLTYDQGYCDYFSFTLPEISGVHTDYILEVNREIDRIYDEFVAPSLAAMEDPEGYPEHFCTAYSHAETDGVHSILITCDSDWGMDYYWCFNFDAWGEAVDNADLLALAGMTPDSFVKTARGFLTDYTDLSEYFEDDGWKTYQAQTVAEDNLNAGMPMAILPDGGLCFIATVYTPAGAGEYDSAFEILDSGDVERVPLGGIAIKQLRGTYLVEREDAEDAEYFLEFLTVGDTLTAQVTAYEPESGGVLYYYAADIIPEDPADLLRADGAPIPVRVLSYCPDIFDGIYYGEAGLYDMTIGEDSVTFSDFAGGTPFVAEAFTARYSYAEDYMLSSTVPPMDYARFDYSQVEESGIAGVWTGYYTDTDYNVHSLTLELTNYGDMRLRDCVTGEIPRVMTGSYYLAGADDDMAEEAGMTVFGMAAVGGYKMPYAGACYIFVDEDGRLEVYDADEEYAANMLLSPTEYICCMDRAPRMRMTTWYRSVTPLAEGDTFTADVYGTGETTAYSYTFVRDHNAGDAITAIIFTLDGEDTKLDDLWLYEAEVYAVEPGTTGAVFFYVDGLSDNDYHYTDIVGADDVDYWYVGSFRGGFDGEPWDPCCMTMFSRCNLLSSATVYRDYRVGLNGLPEPISAFFCTDSELTLTAKRDIDAWKADADSGEMFYDVVLPAGTEVALLRTDGSSFWDLVSDSGDCYRVWVGKAEDGPQTVNGVDIEECFDGIRFAG